MYGHNYLAALASRRALFYSFRMTEAEDWHVRNRAPSKPTELPAEPPLRVEYIGSGPSRVTRYVYRDGPFVPPERPAPRLDLVYGSKIPERE